MCARVCAVAVAVALVEWCSFYVRTILFLVFFIFCIFIHCNLLIEAGSCKSGEKKMKAANQAQGLFYVDNGL